MRVLTYNLHKGRGRARRSIIEDAVKAAADLAPDVLLCQEVFHGVEDAVHQCHFITEVVGHPHVFAPNAFYKRGCHGNATFARLKIDRHRNVDVTESFFEKRGILHTTLADQDGDALDVLNVHFSLTGRQRRRQWFKLVECMPEDPALPVLVAGDFNDWSGSLDRHARQTGILENALWHLPRGERATFPATGPLLGMDRIYFRGLELRSIRVLTGKPWTRLSDHLPVLAEFKPLEPRGRVQWASAP